MSWGAALGALAGLGSAAIGAYANNRAARTSANAARDAAAQYNAAMQPAAEDVARYRANVGETFQTSPGYEFAREQGIRAIDQAASARGLLGSGGRLRELMRYGTGVANQDYANYMNRLASLAGLSQSRGQAMGATNANLIQQQGAANAQGQVGVANALLGGINQGLGVYSMFR